MTKPKILMLGSNGQIGTVLSKALKERYGQDQIICSDINQPKIISNPFEVLDILDSQALSLVIQKYNITQIYHLAAILSAKGEKNPGLTWKVNLDGLINVLNVAVEHKISRVFFPSSIAIYGGSTPKINTPQHASFEPSTVYGISKLAGELWCQYYFNRFGLDVRSLRYPGVVGWQSVPEGGTTDYAVEIYHAALKLQHYTCFLKESTRLPMIYMDDAIRATLELMEADPQRLSIRTSYNLVGMSFTPGEIYAEIKKHITNFTINYQPDFRQQIAESWNETIDDQAAKMDWDWKPRFDLESMTLDMLHHLNTSNKSV
ncbi:MAG: NAD-dependent epimerase/dehydratase family protein [Bacteroidota bacterium]|nr:NAD-dependent epimerase/dehydratase family protein [Bacteroidota bacterium]